MKKTAILLLTIMCVPIVGLGAQIYGNLRSNNASVGPNVLVTIRCEDGSINQSTTDSSGSYSVPARPSKKCWMSVVFGGRSSKESAVYPYDDPVRYDFDVVDNGGAIELRRR
jgi:hypothetical protein